MRISTLSERREYYETEFDRRGLDDWVADRSRHMKLAMIPGRHTGIAAAAHFANKDDVVIIDDWRSAFGGLQPHS